MVMKKRFIIAFQKLGHYGIGTNIEQNKKGIKNI